MKRSEALIISYAIGEIRMQAKRLRDADERYQITGKEPVAYDFLERACDGLRKWMIKEIDTEDNYLGGAHGIRELLGLEKK